MQTPIDSLLRQQAQRGKIRFCMPGHKGMLADNDITEAGAMDNLLHPEGALLQAQSLFGRGLWSRTSLVWHLRLYDGQLCAHPFLRQAG